MVSEKNKGLIGVILGTAGLFIAARWGNEAHELQDFPPVKEYRQTGEMPQYGQRVIHEYEKARTIATGGTAGILLGLGFAASCLPKRNQRS